MAERAKIFRSGTGQVLVELPPSVRFPDDADDVLVRREGDQVILSPASRGWSKEFLDALGSLGPDEVFERPPQTPVTELKDPFD